MNSVSPSSKNSTSINTEYSFAILGCLFITSLIITKVISEKYFLFIGAPVSARDIVYPLTFLFINITAEIYSPQRAKMLITHGLHISIIVAILLWVAKELPMANNSPVSTSDFEKILAPSLSLILASLGAYLIGQFLNLYLFVQLRRLLSGRHLWLRNILASLCAQLADTALLVIALYLLGVALKGQASVFNNMFSQYALKALITLVSSPIVYISGILKHQQLGHKIIK